jgi:hypothetical protein
MLLPTAPPDLGGGMAEVARGGRGKWGVKKSDKWVPQVFVGMEYEV